MQDAESREAHAQVEQVWWMLNGTVDLLEDDIAAVTEPHALALFETTREVLAGLVRT
jgi:hypothetical protein